MPIRPKRPGMPRSSKKDDAANWSDLIKAQQWANHPQLVQIMHLEREAMVAMMNNDEAATDLAENERGASELLMSWQTTIRENENWRSARVDIILDVINRHRDIWPEQAFLIMDESVYFLDILEIAIINMYEPLPCFRYDSPLDPAERFIIMDFFAPTGPRIMLASRDTGDQGLNVQCANVLIISVMLGKLSGSNRRRD